MSEFLKAFEKFIKDLPEILEKATKIYLGGDFLKKSDGTLIYRHTLQFGYIEQTSEPLEIGSSYGGINIMETLTYKNFAKKLSQSPEDMMTVAGKLAQLCL